MATTEQLKYKIKQAFGHDYEEVKYRLYNTESKKYLRGVMNGGLKEEVYLIRYLRGIRKNT